MRNVWWKCSKKNKTLHPSAVILSHGINGLGVVRSLAKNKARAIVISPGKSLAACSRYAIAGYTHNGTYGKEDKELLRLLKGLPCHGSALIPTSDQSVEFIAYHREVLIELGYRFIVPSSKTIAALNDKKTELEMLSNIGIPHPPSITNIPDNSGDILGQIKLPAIIKPRTQSGCDIIKAKNIIITDKAQLDYFIKKHFNHLSLFIIQEIIPGNYSDQWGCSCVFGRNGELLTAFTYQKLGTSPPHFGVTTVGVSIDNPELKRLVKRIGKQTGFVGPADFDFLFDQKTRSYMYIEINPRLGMHNWFDSCCGVETAYETCCLYTSENTERKALRQKDGMYYINFWSDFYARMQDRERLKSIARLYLFLLKSKKVGAVFYWKDPIPAIHHLYRSLAYGIFGLGKRVSKRAQGL